MIDLHYWPTSNGHKITIFLEETGLPYRLCPVDIHKDEQFKPEFLAISPNNRMPAIVDHEPADGGGPLSIFESGAILIYLAEKTGRYLPSDKRGRERVLQWLFWQVGGLGPMLGQKNHFKRKALEGMDEKGRAYAVDRYVKEAQRLYGVLDRELAGQDFVAGDYSIADMAIYPWLFTARKYGDDFAPFASVAAYIDRMSARPAVQAAYARAQQPPFPQG
ncbi:MAG: thiol:disulfide oxidoreductase [Hyphomicrobiales bacterium]|nr:thiol:disulfide oxidoreductase [Hyphomicrobiales bacterium]